MKILFVIVLFIAIVVIVAIRVIDVILNQMEKDFNERFKEGIGQITFDDAETGYHKTE